MSTDAERIAKNFVDEYIRNGRATPENSLHDLITANTTLLDWTEHPRPGHGITSCPATAQAVIDYSRSRLEALGH
jgi:hypothetical protein